MTVIHKIIEQFLSHDTLANQQGSSIVIVNHNQKSGETQILFKKAFLGKPKTTRERKIKVHLRKLNPVAPTAIT